ncbi:FAD-binding oxidoreductase [Thermomonospora amylolytica]|uniref:FAD-binding oxidoreductase n=1 Tax=Thermomonospora amylolytica TaxID=1411117 RepID=UPI001F4709F6|nr:FAD-binding protein [Thermomonospora amylolytica]
MTAPIVDAGGIKITEGDRRYAALCRGPDPRRCAGPDYVRLVGDSAQVRHALEQAVNEPVADPARARIAVRSGGHCHQDRVCAEDVRVVIDMSLMDGVHHDPAMDAICVEAGATGGDLRKRLWLKTGKVMPGGSCPAAEIGGHVPAGGFGPLSRQHGLAVDYLYAVEVAVVGRDRRARLVTATRDSRDERLRELWWAHTGAAGAISGSPPGSGSATCRTRRNGCCSPPADGNGRPSTRSGSPASSAISGGSSPSTAGPAARTTRCPPFCGSPIAARAR